MTIPRKLINGVWKARGYPDLQPPVPGGRDTLVAGTYKPGPSTTGVLPGVPRTDFNSRSTTGLLTSFVANTTYQNLDIWGDAQISVPGVKFKNCYFHGGIGHPGSNRGCVTAFSNNDHNGLELTDCTLNAQSPSYFRDGIVGNSYTAMRCRSFGNTDNFGAYSNPSGAGNCDVLIQQCYSHDNVYWSQDPAHSDGTHNDGIQFQGGSNFHAIGNNLVGSSVDAANSNAPNPRGTYLNGQCLILNQNTHIASDVIIDKNWFSKGSVQLNLNRGTTFSTLTATLGTNSYSRDIFEFYAANSDKRWIAMGATGYSIAGLYDTQSFEDTGAQLTVGRATGIRVIYP